MHFDLLSCMTMTADGGLMTYLMQSYKPATTMEQESVFICEQQMKQY